MYESAADALVGLVSGREIERADLPWEIKTSGNLLSMKNGIDYFFVEVTFSDGVQYGIHGYGKEAEELQQRARELQSGARRMIAPVIMH